MNKILNLDKVNVMGIVNCTPDSFYEGSRKQSENEVLTTVERMLMEGANIIDLGAFSTRPTCEIISIETEIERILTNVSAILTFFPNTILSIDTFRAEVAEKALDMGAKIINDISGGLFDKKMFQTISSYNCTYVLMHLRGTLARMHEPQQYDSIAKNVISEISQRLEIAENAGIIDIIIDPGFGFSKNTEQNIELFKGLGEFNQLKRPLLVGISRKSMIYKTLAISANEALNGTTILNTIAIQKGAKILRVHDVKEAVEVVKLMDAL